MIKYLDAISTWLNRLLVWVAGAFLLGMVFLAGANILCRMFWVPIRGTFELMGFAGAIVTAFALGYTQINRGHISVDVLVETFSRKNRRMLVFINNTICCVFFVLAAWQLYLKADTLRVTGEVTETLRVIYYPFTYAVALGCVILAFVMLVDIFRQVVPPKEERH
jgi:TRAP-type C4-dicarboxylate transport system permease small subunit